MNGEDTNSMLNDSPDSVRDEVPAPAAGEHEPVLDETAFIRRAERRSVRRTLAVSAGVALVTVVLLSVGWFGWSSAIDWQAQRILDYYPVLAEMTMANNQVSGGLVQRDFPGATMRLSAYRRVGVTVVPAGEICVRFYPWGGESFTEPGHIGDISGGRLMIVPGTTPDLLFLEPPVDGGNAEEVWNAKLEEPILSTFANARATSIAKLQSAPPSATVEVAVSFDDVMSLDELQRRLGGDLHLAWGALRVGNAGESGDDEGVVHEAGTTWWPHFPGFSGTVGVAFGATGEETGGESLARRQASQLSEFGVLSRSARGFGADRLGRYSDYLSREGAHYYGAVVTGSPEAALALAKSPDVSTVTLGAVAMPWQ
jgi:hypothetical protein